VAIKVLDPNRRERWSAVSEALPHLTHENLITVHETGRMGCGAYVIMEIIEGGDLRRHTEPGSLLPFTVALSVAARVADALAHLHDHGFVHGDVKPANILYDPAADAVKLADFGCTRGLLPYAGRFTSAGTMAYMSPEQGCGAPIGPASDQFSLGVTLYRLACGRLPFSTSSLPRLLSGIASEKPVDIRRQDRALPSSLAELLDRALAKHPEARYGSVRELATAIRAAHKAPRSRETMRCGQHPVAVATCAT
jgi:serine/threonine protein kinase